MGRVARGASGRGQLSDREQRFVVEILRDNNATRAAIAAGYSVKTAGQIGYQLLQKTSISDAIERGRSRLLQRAEVKAQDIVDRLVVLGFADMGNLAEWDGESATLKPSGEVDTRPVAELSIVSTTTTTKDGSVVETKRTRVKLHNQVQALTKLAELMGIASKGGGGAGESEPSVKVYCAEDWDRIPS